jgi:hypothetical protein
MNSYKLLLPKTMWLGTIGLTAVLLGWTPSCKAQEVNPAIFTNTGVEDAYPVQKPLAKKIVKVQVAANPKPISSNEATARKQKANEAARKQNVAYGPSL